LGAIQSAVELFGVGSIQVQTTIEAFDAVEVFDSPTNPQPTPFPGNNGLDATLFVYWDATAGANFLGRYEPSLGDVAPGIKLSQNPVAPTRPSISGDGTFAIFVDAQQDFCLINTDGQSFETCLGFPGTVNSVAMAPGGETLGIVFLNALGNPDNTISTINLTTSEIQTFTLVSPAYDSTTFVEVLLADAMDFTANNRFLVYDAFNALSFSDGRSLGLWSIYAIDLLTKGTLTLLPPTVGFDIAFPALAQTSDGHFTFDVLDNTIGQNFVLAGNLYTGALSVVGTTSTFTAPGYTGDDTGIIYSRSDLAVPTQSSLVHQSVLADRITPTGSTTNWLADADYSVVYRRGEFSRPVQVDLSVASSFSASETVVNALNVLQITVRNTGPNTATGVTVTITPPVGVTPDTDVLQLCSPSGTQFTCLIPDIATSNTAGPYNINFIPTERGVFRFGLSVISDQTDTDTSDNIAFAEFTAPNRAPVPTTLGPLPGFTVQAGTFFTRDLATAITDPDGDVLFFDEVGLPLGVELTPSGEVVGPATINSASPTPYQVTVTATDPFGASASVTFAITVTAAPTGGGGGSGGGGCTVGGEGSLDPTLLLLLLICTVYLFRRRYSHIE